jgi:hypothetical protein
VLPSASPACSSASSRPQLVRSSWSCAAWAEGRPARFTARCSVHRPGGASKVAGGTTHHGCPPRPCSYAAMAILPAAAPAWP